MAKQSSSSSHSCWPSCCSYKYFVSDVLCLLLGLLHNKELIISDERGGILSETWNAYLCSLPLCGIYPLVHLAEHQQGLLFMYLFIFRRDIAVVSVAKFCLTHQSASLGAMSQSRSFSPSSFCSIHNIDKTFNYTPSCKFLQHYKEKAFTREPDKQ